MNKPYSITGLIVHCLCSDGKLREVQLSPTAAMTIGNTVRHVSGGTVKLFGCPRKVVADENWLLRKLKSLGGKKSS